MDVQVYNTMATCGYHHKVCMSLTSANSDPVNLGIFGTHSPVLERDVKIKGFYSLYEQPTNIRHTQHSYLELF